VKDFDADFKWAILADIDWGEAIEPAKDRALTLTFAALAIAALVAVLGILLARAISKPLTILEAQSKQAGKGDLTAIIAGQDRNDELGSLARTMGKMLSRFREQTRSTLEGINVLSSSATEISSTVQQLAVSSARTFSAITETTTTIEQVRQSARIATENAKKVAETSLQSVEISESGRKATEDTVNRMNLIKEQMESIGETVVRLSEHSQAIEDIMATVQDLADQSNLLAVNASIEAARAGEQGKGFSVVAQEIKMLADQSREATGQVRTILEDTRKWVGAVVMATEQGAKAVDAGVAQSKLAGDSIRSLADSVIISSQAASVIHASGEQQSVGMDQVSAAMSKIETAMQQNVESVSQMETAAKELENLGATLEKLVARYTV
jgi:methyl-accepting chemotaxis protein